MYELLEMDHTAGTMYGTTVFFLETRLSVMSCPVELLLPLWSETSLVFLGCCCIFHSLRSSSRTLSGILLTSAADPVAATRSFLRNWARDVFFTFDISDRYNCCRVAARGRCWSMRLRAATIFNLYLCWRAQGAQD